MRVLRPTQVAVADFRREPLNRVKLMGCRVSQYEYEVRPAPAVRSRANAVSVAAPSECPFLAILKKDRCVRTHARARSMLHEHLWTFRISLCSDAKETAPSEVGSERNGDMESDERSFAQNKILYTYRQTRGL